MTGTGLGSDHASQRRTGAGPTLWLVLFAAALVVQLVVLYIPRGPGGPEVNGVDKVIHLSVFAVPTFAALCAGWDRRLVVLAFAVHAPVSELVQGWLLPHRDGDVGDVVADLTGVVLALLAFVSLARRRRW